MSRPAPPSTLADRPLVAAAEPRPRLAKSKEFIREARNPLLLNGYLLTLSTVLSAGVGFGYWAVAAWRYAPASVGSNSAAISMMMFVAAIAQLNQCTAMVRFAPIAGKRVHRLVGGAYLICGSLALAIGTLSVFAVRAVAPGETFLEDNPAAAMFVIATVAYVLFVIQDGVLVALRRAEVVPIENLLFGLAKLGLVAAIAAAMPHHGIFASWTVALVAVVAIVTVYLFVRVIPKHRRETDRDDLPPPREIARFVAFDYLGAICGLASIHLVPIIVLAVRGADQNAYFAIAWLIAYNSVHLFNINMGTSLLAAGATDPDGFEGARRRLVIHTAKLVVPLMLVVVIAAPWLLRVFGPEYRSATDALRLLAVAGLPHLVVTIAINSARVQRRLGFLLWLQIGQAVLVLSMAWWLVHGLGIIGAALGWLLGQSVLAGCLLMRRDLWFTAQQIDRVANPFHARHFRRLVANFVVVSLRLLTLLGMRGRVERCVGRLRGRAGREVAPGLSANPWLADQCRSLGWEQVETVHTVTDVGVTLLGPPRGPAAAALKIARGSRAATELRTQRCVLADLNADPRLTGWDTAIPRTLLFHEGPDAVGSVETFCAGDTFATLLMGNHGAIDSVTEAALIAIAEFHGRTGSVARVDQVRIHRWLDEPLEAIADMCRSMDPARLGAVERLAEILSVALYDREVLESWVHGDYTPENVLSMGTRGPVTGIVDWGGARPCRLAIVDYHLFILTAGRLVEGREFGAVVRSRLRGGLLPRERRSLQVAYHTTGMAPEATGGPGERIVILLAWLFHAAEMWRKCDRYRRNRVWWAANVLPVLRMVDRLDWTEALRPGTASGDAGRDLAPAVAAPTVAVVICAYTEERWEELKDAVESVRRQTVRPEQIIVVIDCNAALFRRAVEHLPGVLVVPNTNRKGLSGARNTGVAAARADVVAFLDDDAVAARDWLAALLSAYADPQVIGVGGAVLPRWEAGRPHWFPPEFDWVVGCSYHGMPERRSTVRNFIGANMSLRRSALMRSGGFDTRLGRVGTRPVGCEETEVCIRIQRDVPGSFHVYEPSARVRHHVPGARASLRYYRSRCFSEGLSKAAVSHLVGQRRALESEKSYVRSVIPRAVVAALGNAVRGRPAGMGAATALVFGVATTTLGYVVGRVRTMRRPTAGRVLDRSFTVLGLPLAIALWVVSLPRIDLGRIGDFGLVPLLPVTFWVALAMLLLSFAVQVWRGASHRLVLCAHLIGLIAILHATPSILYGTLRYSWAWKHVGVVDFFLRHEGADSTVRELNVYQRWPGFFTLNAGLLKAAGQPTALAYASWAPAIFGLLALAPLYWCYRSLTSDPRLRWSALGIYVLGAWVGQDYFAPQPVAYLLYLTIIAVCLRYRHRVVDASSPVTHRALVFAVLVLMIAAIAPSHQLTPLMVVSALFGLAFFIRMRVKWVLAIAIATTLGWDLVFAWPWIHENLASISSSIGNFGGNAKSGLNIAEASRSQAIVAHIDRTHSAAIGLLAAVGFLRQFRRDRDMVPAVLAVAPIPLILTNDYGGEMIFRVYLFALPFLAFYAAAAFFPRPSAGRRPRTAFALSAVLLVLVPGFLYAYYGKEQASYFSRNEVATSQFVYGIAPRGSLIIGETSDFPWGFTNYEFYDYIRFGRFEPDDRKAVLDDPVGMFKDMMAKYHHAYLIVTRGQVADVEMSGVFPPGGIAAMVDELLGSKKFTVIYRNSDGMVITMVQPDVEDGP